MTPTIWDHCNGCPYDQNLRVLAQGQRVSFLHQLYLLQKRHTQKHFVATHIGIYGSPYIMQNNVPKGYLSQGGSVRVYDTVGGARSDPWASFQTEFTRQFGGDRYCCCASVQQEVRGPAIDFPSSYIVTSPIS